MKVNYISILTKVIGVLILISALVLKMLGLTSIDMIEVIQATISLQILVLPIDISKVITNFNRLRQ